jgi:hypothetical protein
MSTTFGNWSTEQEVKGKYKELFKEIYNDDGSLTALSKEVFEHYEPDENGEEKIWFKYHLGIQVTSMYSYLSEDEDGHDIIHFELFIVPLVKYLHENKLKDIVSSYGIETSEVTLRDIIDYGGCPILEKDSIHSSEEYYDVTENEDVMTKLDTCAHISVAVNGTRGFALDKAWNAIGSTGWDLLHDMINGEDFIKRTLNRYKESEVK